MAMQPIGSRPGYPASGHPDATAWNRSYLLAGVRAGLIALALLVALTLLVLL